MREVRRETGKGVAKGVGAEAAKEVAKETLGEDSWRLKFHLMPPQGWMNDPNGLCYFGGKYHVFFQYQPEDAQGGSGHPKVWGHYAGEDFLHMQFEGIPFPCGSLDQNGAYSGSALVAEGKMQLFYTGNVRLAGAYDYIHAGRISNTLRITSDDGVHFGEKELLLENSDYPSACTCHVRDPKVWQEGERSYMLLGARLQEDRGAVLLYESSNLLDWKYRAMIEADPSMGYMWECPDYFTLGDHRVLASCPQGVTREEESFQNVYSSGYYLLPKALPMLGAMSSEDQRAVVGRKNYREWDKGFDFYAPQTFEDDLGRRILIGWAGMPDAEYQNPTVDRGWQHALTVPRELLAGSEVIRQRPVEELKQLRYGQTSLSEEGSFLLEDASGDLEIEKKDSDPGRTCEDWTIHIGKGCKLSYEKGWLRLELEEGWGYGRGRRQARIGSFRNARILVDTSLVEVYVNDGEMVLTSRFYPSYSEEKEGPRLELDFHCPGLEITGWQMKAMEEQKKS